MNDPIILKMWAAVGVINTAIWMLDEIMKALK